MLALLCAASLLLTLDTSAWRKPPDVDRTRQIPRIRNKHAPPEELPRLVRQLASLLAAGRTGPVLWGALVHVLTVEADGATNERGGSGSILWSTGPSQAPPTLSQLRINGPPQPADATILLVLAVQRASTLGLPASASIREACSAALANERGHASARGAALTAEQRRTWLELAACFEVCEASGAGVTGVLNRLAAAIEAEQDAAALRETALAGPRATVRLLSWLPFVGLGLGMSMGVDPLGALLGGPIGLTVLAVGVTFALAGWAWSSKMIATAAAPPSARRIRTANITGGSQHRGRRLP